jgi:hypothetical protein
MISVVRNLFGAETPVVLNSDEVGYSFAFGGDYAISFAPELEQIIEAGVSNHYAHNFVNS